MPLMTRRNGKPKPPTYPRPVPNLEVEELSHRPADDAFYTEHGQSTTTSRSGSDVGHDVDPEAEAAMRAAKRRRIEAHAHAYLRGHQLHIMSARLRGPFGGNWKSPWTSKRENGRQGILAQNCSPKTPKPTRAPLIVDESKAETGVVAAGDICDEENGVAEQQDAVSKARKSDNRIDGVAPLTEVSVQHSPLVQGRSKKSQVTDWLRTNQALGEIGQGPSSPVSPTPLTTSRMDVQVARSFEEQAIVPPRTPRTASAAVGRIQQLSRDMNKVVAMSTAKAVPRSNAEVHCDMRDVSRAETYIANIRTARVPSLRTEQELSPSRSRGSTGRDVPSNQEKFTGSKIQPQATALAQVDTYRREELITRTHPVDQFPSHREQLSSSSPPTAKLEQSSNQNRVESVLIDTDKMAQEDSQIGKKSDDCRRQDLTNHSINMPPPTSALEERTTATDNGTRPALSEASDLTTNDMLPSAQQPPQLHPSISSGLLEVHLLDIETIPKEIESITGEEDGEANGLIGCEPGDPSCSRGDTAITHGSFDASNGVNNTPTAHSRTIEANVHDLLEDIPPIQSNTVKKRASTTRQEASTTTLKGAADRKRKRASFTADQQSTTTSQRSLKSTMNARIAKSFGSSPLFSSAKDNLENLDTTDLVGDKVSRLSGTSQPSRPRSTKSILKNVCATRSQQPTIQRSGLQSSSHLQDGQIDRVVGSIRPTVVDDDEFDLEAAIDDLGSFLGSWDAEKEASGVAG